jgi:hypothetical protein
MLSGISPPGIPKGDLIDQLISLRVVGYLLLLAIGIAVHVLLAILYGRPRSSSGS